MITTITVGQLIEILSEVKNKNMPVYIAEQKNKVPEKNKNGEAIYEVKKKYGIINGGQALTAFILAFDKDRKI
ncbi:hypothetical protein Q5M87_06975 [Brachyspira innocens]|uniref:Uncharacterized protein n=1 Tax=Brachyspira innocens TaxID=13264 RepID=A0ABT8YXI9_9SPIR|nr:hypothetical protein [Brachyspira innocens]MDO6993752.1 hypothetical protein [Brachyspira innocens]MDO7020594.1 hypothetical protein [Brachyspira innocens]